MTRQINATDLKLWIAHEEAAGNFERAEALRCLLVWVNGGSYIVPGAGHE